MNESNDPPTKERPTGLTLSVVILASAAVGITVFLVQRTSETRLKSSNSRLCLDHLHNLGAAMELYRADNNGFSPNTTSGTNREVIAKLTKYAKTALDPCPNPGAPIQFRLLSKNGTKEKLFYGTMPNSVIAYCMNHENTKSRVLLSKGKPLVVQEVNWENRGLTNILLRDGSARSILASTGRRMWLYEKGVFKILKSGPSASMNSSQLADGYPFEPPPQFEY